MRTAAVILALLALTHALPAQTGVAEKAEASIREGFPQAAIAPLEEALRTAPAAAKPPLVLLLGRAQLAAGRPGDALRTLDGPADRASSDAVLLRAAALSAQGGLEDAAKILEPLASGSPAAALLLARVRFEQGQTEVARELLTTAGKSAPTEPNALRLFLDLQLALGDPAATEAALTTAREQSLLPAIELDTALGRLRLAQGRPSDAAEIFRQVLTSNDTPARVRENARLGLARSLLALGVDNRARDALREGITEAPDSGVMRETMEQWILLEEKLGTDPSTELRAWAAEEGSRRGFEARLQLARIDLARKRPDAAAASLESLVANPELSPVDNLRVRLLLAETRIAAGQTPAALQLLDGLPPAAAGAASQYLLADLRGRAFAADGAYRRANEAFATALASASTPQETAAAAANGLITALAAEDLPLARRSYEVLRQAEPASPELVRWSFLLATAEARDDRIDGLGALARRAPSVEYAFLAKLALAEWRLARGEPSAAERILRTARDDADTPARNSALAAAEIFAADSAGSLSREELEAACTKFLAEFPDAPEGTDISFKLGELHSRAGNHAAAELVFTDLAATLADPESASLAKFLAAQSASRSMSAEGNERALVWFDEIAQTTSSLRYRARFEQASLLIRARRFDDALTLYDRILAAKPPDEVRHAALMEKGDTLFALGADSPDKFREAAAVYASLSANINAPADWRDQAACKRATALTRTGRTDEALAVYREVLTRPPGTKADQFWFYKSGLEAARLLEDQQDWPAAIAIYDRMASANGPQREELTQRARRLRLEHFIWEN
jgi:TolA-binding protein